MVDVTLASLAMGFNVDEADPAKVKLRGLREESAALEQQAIKTAAAGKVQATSHGLAGTAAGQAEKAMRGLVGVYGNAFNATSSYGMSTDATVKLILQNAKTTEALTREQARAAKQVETLTRAYDPLQAEILKTNRQIEEATRLQGAQGVTADGLRGKLANLQKAHAATGEAARLQSYQLLNLGRQGADVFVSLASGQAIWMVAIQQGAQIGEIFADAATQGVGLKAALAGIAAQVGPMLAIGAPLIAIGGAIAAAAIAFNQGDKEAAKLANTLALAGSNAGITAVQFEQFARQVGSETKAGTDEARKALLGLTETGKFSGQTIKVLGEDVVQFSRLTGKSTQEAVAYFSQMGAGVADFAAKFGQAYGGITLAQIEHIQLLERQGATTQAQLEASIMIHDRLGKAGPVNLGYLEQAWRGVSTAIKEAWTWLKTWGNESAGRANAMQNIQDQIRLNNERLQGNPTNGNGRSFLDEERRQLEARNKGLQSQLTALKAVEAAEQKRVQAEATANQVQADGIAAANEHAGSWAKIARNVSLATQEIERYRKGQADIRAANPNSKELDSPTQAAAIEAGIRKRYEHLTKQPAVSAATRADARGDNAVEQAQAAELAARRGLTKNIEEVARIRGEEIAQELQTQRVRLEGQVRTKQITDTDAKTAIASYERAAASKKAAVDQQLFSDQVARQRALEDTIAGYTDRQAQSQVALASSLEQAQAIENKALADRQQRAAGRRDFDLFMEWADGKKTEAEVQQVQAAAAGADAADREVKARNDRLAIFQRDLQLAQAASANEVDILNSRRGLAQSSYEASRIERQILEKTYAAERDRLTKIIANKDTDAKTLTESQGRLVTIEEIHKNELRQLELSDNAVTAYADLVGALSNAARAVIDGDIGGSISAAGGVLKQLSGLAGSGPSLGSALGSAAAYAGPIGAAVSAVTGVLGAIGDKSAAKAQAKLDALNKSVEALRTDNKTSSGSIAGALEEANKAWNADLEYTSQMVTSLRSIDNQIGALANALSRQITAGGLLSTSTLGLGKTGGGGLFGSSSNAELLDQGLAFNPTTYGQGVTGSTYADLATTKTKKFLGVTTGVKVSNSTVNGAIDPSLLGQINGIIEALGNGVLSAASVFGVEAAKAAETALGSAVVDLGKLSLKDLKPDEIAAVLQATFDKVGDQLAAAGVPGLDKLATVGEGSFETLTRLAREYQVVDTSLAALGKQFGATGLESLGLRKSLLDLFNGVDDFAAKTSFFASNFLTDAEQLAPVIKAVNDNLAQFGLSATSTRDQFKSLVLAQDLTTEAGRNTYAALLALAPAFDKVAAAAEAAAQQAADLAKARDEGFATFLSNYQEQVTKAARIEAAEAAKIYEAERTAAEGVSKAWDELVAKVNDGRQALLRAGDVSGALAGENSIRNGTSLGAFTTGGVFDALGFNLVRALDQSRLGQKLLGDVSSSALDVENVGSAIGKLIGVIRDPVLVSAVANSVSDGLTLGIGSAATRDAVSDAFSDAAKVFTARNVSSAYGLSGSGIASVLSAMERTDAAGRNDDVAAYQKAIENLDRAFDRGQVSMVDYVQATQNLNEAMGPALSLVGDLAAQQERYAEALSDLGRSGIDSIGYYFGQITTSATALAAAAAQAEEPISLVTQAIGRLTSIGDVFGQSAKAAVAGGYATDKVSQAALIAQSAAIAAQALTSADAARVAKEIASNSAFAALDAVGIRNAALLLDGVKAFDPKAFEAAFLRINNALIDGAINEEQYSALFGTAMATYTDEIGKTTEAFAALRSSAKSLADSLLIDPALTSLSAAQQLAEAQRQYRATYNGAMGGDQNAIGAYDSAARSLLSAGRASFATREEYDQLLAGVVSDARFAENAEPINPYVEANAPIVTELKALREEVAGLRAENKATNEKIALNTSAQRRLAEDAAVNGQLVVTE